MPLPRGVIWNWPHCWSTSGFGAEKSCRPGMGWLLHHHHNIWVEPWSLEAALWKGWESQEQILRLISQPLRDRPWNLKSYFSPRYLQVLEQLIHYVTLELIKNSAFLTSLPEIDSGVWGWICIFIYYFFFPFIFISWRLITLQYCSGFCHTLTWISHGFTCVPHPDPPSHFPLHPLPLGLPSAPGLSTCLMHPTWAGDLFHPW